ncbi:hypothetical protein PMAYCL1PPCAC_19408, partial [Pristionchus mayeri]
SSATGRRSPPRLPLVHRPLRSTDLRAAYFLSYDTCNKSDPVHLLPRLPYTSCGISQRSSLRMGIYSLGAQADQTHQK